MTNVNALLTVLRAAFPKRTTLLCFLGQGNPRSISILPVARRAEYEASRSQQYEIRSSSVSAIGAGGILVRWSMAVEEAVLRLQIGCYWGRIVGLVDD
jgi:hypothetical protein